VVQGLKLWGWCDALTTDSDVEMEEESWKEEVATYIPSPFLAVMAVT
jgi:hypothetical protein